MKIQYKFSANILDQNIDDHKCQSIVNLRIFTQLQAQKSSENGKKKKVISNSVKKKGKFNRTCTFLDARYSLSHDHSQCAHCMFFLSLAIHMRLAFFFFTTSNYYFFTQCQIEKIKRHITFLIKLKNANNN